MATPSTSTAEKRRTEEILVDPDTMKPIETSKKPKIDLDSHKKRACILSIVEMYNKTLKDVFAATQMRGLQAMDTEDTDSATYTEALNSITVGNHVVSIIFTIHNVSRQSVKGTETNMINKTKTTSFKIHFKGKDYNISNDVVKKNWDTILRKNGLQYKDFNVGDEENWYGTMGPYLDMFSAYSLRVNELRLGHNNMPITKVDGAHRSFPVSKYGLSGAHHVLLEGASFPPERRSSIVQSLGPMTSWLCMLRSEGIYRKKYAAAVKRAMSHVPCIDDLIEITKNTKQASEIATITTLVAEILLITTARQATRMFFPITIFSAVLNKELDRNKFIDYFSTTGNGGWYTYKVASSMKNKFTVSGRIEEEMASQIVFHGIFGTFTEDLSILSQITNVANWYTREEMGTCFRQQGNSNVNTNIILPEVRYYAKMSCANQTGLLSGVYNQVATVPCFSGARRHIFDSSFLEHIEKKRIMSNTGKTVAQIVNILTSTLEELHDKLRKENGKITMGTTKWKTMSSLNIDEPGEEIEIVLEGRGKMFLGKAK